MQLETIDQKLKLRNYVEILEQYEADKASTQDSIKDVMEAAKEAGLNPKAIRTVLRLRRKSAEEREEEDSVVIAYLAALEDA